MLACWHCGFNKTQSGRKTSPRGKTKAVAMLRSEMRRSRVGGVGYIDREEQVTDNKLARKDRHGDAAHRAGDARIGTQNAMTSRGK